MKPFDYLEYLDSFTAELAVLSTYNFDPVFFERRLLRRKALDKAQRIAVVVDADEWAVASRSDQPIRWANSRYLVVPVFRSRGVFHPKLHMFVSESDAVVSCGSGNLTRPGMTHNLELQNVFHGVADEGTWSRSAAVATQALQFFKAVAASSDSHGAEILGRWLQECWSYQLPIEADDDEPTLLHTVDLDLWHAVSKAMDEAVPRRITILSPFFDDDLRLLKRVRERWPEAALSIIAQSHSSRLDAGRAVRIDRDIKLATLTVGARRLHAKLLAWEGEQSSGCLVGSANFTAAAFDGRNLEASMLLKESKRGVESLFAGEAKPQDIDPDEFVPGDASEPGPRQEHGQQPLAIADAHIDADGRLAVEYAIADPSHWESVSVGVRGVRDIDPSVVRQVANKPTGGALIGLSETPFAGGGGAMRCSLIGTGTTGRAESRVAWVIQEAQLTRERGTSHSSRVRGKIEQSGGGLAERLAEIGSQEGFGGMIEFLDQVNIRFYDGSGRPPGGRSLSIRIADPWVPGRTPKWLDEETVSAADLKGLGKSIRDYADRHEKTRLRRHAKKGNINGLENFCDVLASMTQMLLAGFTVWRRGQLPAVPRNQIIGRLCRYIDLATKGCEPPESPSPGYLATLQANLAGDRPLLKARCEAADLAELLVAVLRAAQSLRALADDVRGKVEASRLLAESSRTLQEALVGCGLGWPSDEAVQRQWMEFGDSVNGVSKSPHF